MRIAIVCHYFHPEIGAPSARLSSLAKELTALGHSVVVVTGFPNHPTGVILERYRGRLVAREDYDGVEVLRNWLYATSNEGFVKKTLGHLSFMVSAVVLGGPRLGQVDAIIVSSPTFFSVLSAWVLSILKRAPFVFEVRDLWPAVFVELGVLKNKMLIALLEGVEMFLYRRSAAVVTVTQSFADILVKRGIPREKLTTITNGVDLEEFQPQPQDEALKAQLGAQGKLMVLYIGAHGISHALEAILVSARSLQDEPDVVFVFVGEGAEKRKLQQRVEEWGLKNVRFLPGQPRDQVTKFYATADVCLVPLRNIPLFDTFIPSKMFEIMGCARPIIGSVRGEPRDILAASGSAILVEPEDSQGVCRAILALKVDPARRKAMGESGRAFVLKNYQRRALAARYAELLEKVARR